jgi:hypothetical protein
VDSVVEGQAVGTGGAEPHPIESVTVQVAGQPAVEAELFPGSFESVTYRATTRFSHGGPQQLVVTATDDIGRSVTRAITVGTPDTGGCREGQTWINYSHTQSATPESTCGPVSLAGLVAAVRKAEAAGKRAHAYGSRWSYSDCALTSDYLISTGAFHHPLQTVQSALLPGQSPLIFHVEAGISIEALYLALRDRDLALETMGATAGQTLAGAISTGTHGGDKFLPPLADSVLAIHLVGAGGTQFWIEPSKGITDPTLLRERVIPDVAAQNIVYDDATFDACLVSLGCMGVIYAVVLRVRAPYDLEETTTPTSWQVFKLQASSLLTDPKHRFLQLIVNPYRDGNADNLCLVTTRSEEEHTRPGTRPLEKPEPTVRQMIDSMHCHAKVKLLFHNLCRWEDPWLSPEERLAWLVQEVLNREPSQRRVMVDYYGRILSDMWPAKTFRGSSYSVMDRFWGQQRPVAQPSYSIEMSFPAVDELGRLGFAGFVDALIQDINAADDTFFVGYVALRFTGATRATLGMQQWDKTCAVEISVVQGIRGLEEMIGRLYRIGINHGGLPHWGQMLDLGVQGYAGVYSGFHEWRKAYQRMSNEFTQRTFDNALSSRWQLTTFNAAEFVSQTVSQTMVTHQSQTVSVTMRNTGTSPWTTAGGYRLGSQNPPDNLVWGVNRNELPADVPPGATVTFQFSIRAPAQPGGYRFQWRMVQEFVEWFGDSTADVPIGVSPPPNLTTVPDVLESRPTGASNSIRAADLVPAFTGPLGADSWVVSQSPVSGRVVPRGTTVTCQLRRGPMP